MVRRTKTVFPMDDGSLRQQEAISQQPDDPRTLGRGPCGPIHQKPHSEQELRQGVQSGHLKQLGNGFACYLKCAKCALRVGYWPRHEATGEYRKLWQPRVVDTALEALRQNGLWDSCSHEDVEQELTSATQLHKAQRANRRSPSSPQKGTAQQPWQPRPASTPPRATGTAATAPSGYLSPRPPLR